MEKLLITVITGFFAFLFIGNTCAAEASENNFNTFPAFSSQNINGEPISNKIFSEKKLTMINIWATWCPPCVREMPDLGNLARSMPDETQLLGIIIDVESPNNTETIKQAKEILAKSKADFIQIVPSSEMAPILNIIQSIPTTIFVDSNGNIIGEPVIGSRSEQDYRAEIEKLKK